MSILGTAASYTGDFSAGDHIVTLTVTDEAGANNSDEVLVTVNANQAPVANAGQDQTASDADGNGVESITLDGSESYDPDGTTLSYEWKEGLSILGTAASYTGDFSVGVHSVTLTVTDEAGANNSDGVIVTVNEAAPLPTMHIASIDVSFTSTKEAGPNIFGYATAVVTIVNETGIPVQDAIVSGYWSGATSDSDDGNTDNSGTVSLDSDTAKVRSGAEFTFTVTDVYLADWTYNASANVEYYDSITVP